MSSKQQIKINISKSSHTNTGLLIIKILFFTLCLKSGSGNCQTSPIPSHGTGTELIPPSPDAFALGKYGLIPVSLYTGIPDISIDLGTAEGREISIPISLNYHNNGLKSYEKAASVGLGWSLNAGGIITRIIRDKVDELTNKAYRYDENINNFSASGNVNLDNVQDYLDGAMHGGTYDTEPDIYVYNFGKYSGSFFFFKNQVYQFPYRKLKITGTLSGPFTITTEDGNIYTFSTTESSSPKNSSTAIYSIPKHISSWYLTTIQPPNKKETITFNYSGVEPVVMHGGSGQSYLKKAYGNSILEQKSSTVPTTVDAIHLTSISTTKMTVSFSSQTTLRTDIDGTGHALDNISFSNSSGKVIKNYKLNYGYFGAGHQLASPLKLISVVEDYNYLKKTHSFEYNDDANFPVLVDATDHWGYSNGSVSPAIIIPNTIVSNGANREPNNTSLLGMLKKVTYPTGGESRFEYEPNIYFVGKNYEKKAVTVAGDLIRQSPSDNTLLLYTNTFTLSYPQDVVVSFRRNPKEVASSDPNAPNGPNAFTKNLEPEVTISPVDGTTGSVHKFLINYNYENAGLTQTVNLPAGDYQVDVKCDSKELSVSGIVGYFIQTNIPIEGSKGPGQRIKAITAFSNTSGQLLPSSAKYYSYVDDAGFSTGQLLKGVNYLANQSYKVETYGGSTIDTEEYQVYNSSISATLYDLINQEMYYKQIDEKEIALNDTLKSRSKFVSYLNAYDYLGTDIKLTEKIDYKKIGAAYTPVLKNQYSYGLKLDTIFSALKPYQTLQIVIQPGSSGPARQRKYSWNWYGLQPSAWVYNKSHNIISYSGTDSTTINMLFVNDIARTHNLIMQKETLSNGYKKITKYKYPESYSASLTGSLLDAHMLSPVLEQQSWLQKSANDSVLTAGIIDEYDGSLFKLKNQYKLHLISPVSTLDNEPKNSDGIYNSLISDSKYINRMNYTYDSVNGNLLSQDILGRDAEKQTSYIWGNDNNYPVAKCNNGAANDFRYINFEDGGTGTIAGSGHTGTYYYNGDYNLNFTPPNSKKQYFYSFWYLQDGRWRFSGENIYLGPQTITLGDAIDDVKVYPSDGQMTTYSYLPGVGLASITDFKDKTLYYEYDASQRLTDIRDQDGNIIKKYDYHYKQ